MTRTDRYEKSAGSSYAVSIIEKFRPMFIRNVVLAAIFATLVAMGNAAIASEQDAALLIHRLGNQSIEMMRVPGLSEDERKHRFRGLLIQGFDIAFIGRFVLGRYWRRATPGQRADYTALYGEFFLQSYASRLVDYAGQTLVVTGARQANTRDFVVRSLIQRPGGQPIVAHWRVREIGGRYRIIDIMVEGVSLAITQRSEFASLARRGGLEGLISTLRERTGSISKTAALD